jgi:hypothetical protein
MSLAMLMLSLLISSYLLLGRLVRFADTVVRR